jgi:hypothetical protein
LARGGAQSTRSSPQGGPSGFDAGKKVRRRKRRLAADTLGPLLTASASAASLQDRDAGLPTVARAAEKYPELARLFVDSAHAGASAQRIEHDRGIRVEVVRHAGNRSLGRWIDAVQPDLRENADGFVPLLKRWVVERTHARNERARRLVIHHDVRTGVSETWVRLAEARILVRRLTTEVAAA